MRVKSYDTLSNYYDLIYHELVDYKYDCAILERIFRQNCELPVSRILDLGCGTGNHDFILANRGYIVTGVDLSREMISVARKKLSEKGHSLPIVSAEFHSGVRLIE